MTNLMPEEHIKQVVTSVVKQFTRKNAPADVNDMEQEAWLIAMESLQRFQSKGKVNITGDLRGWLYRGVARSLGDSVSRWLAVPSIKSNVNIARTVEHRVEVKDYTLSTYENPENDVITLEQRRKSSYAKTRIRIEMERMVLALPDSEQEVIRCSFGLDREIVTDRNKLARNLKIPVRFVYKTVSKFRIQMKKSNKLRTLNAESEELP